MESPWYFLRVESPLWYDILSFEETRGEKKQIFRTLQMFAGIYGEFIGKSECGDFKFMGIACNPQSL